MKRTLISLTVFITIMSSIEIVLIFSSIYNAYNWRLEWAAYAIVVNAIITVAALLYLMDKRFNSNKIEQETDEIGNSREMDFGRVRKLRFSSCS